MSDFPWDTVLLFVLWFAWFAWLQYFIRSAAKEGAMAGTTAVLEQYDWDDDDEVSEQQPV